jgi:hypothetical protein
MVPSSCCWIVKNPKLNLRLRWYSEKSNHLLSCPSQSFLHGIYVVIRSISAPEE